MPNRDYQAERREYEFARLSRSDLHPDPYIQFSQWMDQAHTAQVNDPTAMTLATVDSEGRPHSRIVLLKGFDSEGAVFYTHYDSAKGQEISSNPHAALLFFWPELDRQIRLEGRLTKLATARSDAYFQSRPRDSQLAAYISHQSQKIADRDTLENRLSQAKKDLENQPVPRPEHWGGYAMTPIQFEFWQGRPNRLHDRFQYTLGRESNNEEHQAWQISRLSP